MRIVAGLDSVPSSQSGNDETGLRVQLKDARAALERAIADQARLEQAAAHDEQRRISQILHDTVSQSLTGVYLQTLVLARQLQKNGSEVSVDVANLADKMHLVVTELHEVSQRLQSPADAAPEEG